MIQSSASNTSTYYHIQKLLSPLVLGKESMMTLGSGPYWSRQWYNKDTACLCRQAHHLFLLSVLSQNWQNHPHDIHDYVHSITHLIHKEHYDDQSSLYHWLHYTLSSKWNDVKIHANHHWQQTALLIGFPVPTTKRDYVLYNRWVWKRCIVKDVGEMHYPMGLILI